MNNVRSSVQQGGGLAVILAMPGGGTGWWNEQYPAGKSESP
ncbi:MAG: hypothetical protein ABSD58_04310 [Verrucomicrobiia bacterium]